ncbi:MAG: hypothetical protein LBM75_09885 [Myxococcales bacterium]|jgi:hypothetical protein|nr:hypothetical protein [Myxococcales bacterium]
MACLARWTSGIDWKCENEDFYCDEAIPSKGFVDSRKGNGALSFFGLERGDALRWGEWREAP